MHYPDNSNTYGNNAPSQTLNLVSTLEALGPVTEKNKHGNSGAFRAGCDKGHVPFECK